MKLRGRETKTARPVVIDCPQKDLLRLQTAAVSVIEYLEMLLQFFKCPLVKS